MIKMKTAKDLELSLLLKEKTIQDLKKDRAELISSNVKLREIKVRIKQYIENNYQYVNDIMKQYFDMILYIIKDGEDKDGKN